MTLSYFVRMHTNTIQSYLEGEKKRSNILCGGNTPCQFQLIIWHSLFSSGWEFCETFLGFSRIGEHPKFQAT